jgi:hypothetical protein
MADRLIIMMAVLMVFGGTIKVVPWRAAAVDDGAVEQAFGQR